MEAATHLRQNEGKVPGYIVEDVPARNDLRTEVQVLVIFVRGTLRVAEALRAVTQTAALSEVSCVALAINEFETAVPDAKTVRDVLEHFDEYLRGKGNHPLDHSLGFSIDLGNDDVVLRFGGASLSLQTAADAAEKLTADLRDCWPPS
jgi:hypothetical protein